MKILRFILFTLITFFAVKSLTKEWFTNLNAIQGIFSFLVAVIINAVGFGLADQLAGDKTPEELEAEDQMKDLI